MHLISCIKMNGQTLNIDGGTGSVAADGIYSNKGFLMHRGAPRALNRGAGGGAVSNLFNLGGTLSLKQVSG